MKLQYKSPFFPVLSARLIHIKINKTVEYKKELSSCKLATRRAFDAFNNLFNFGYFKTNRLTKKKKKKRNRTTILFLVPTNGNGLVILLMLSREYQLEAIELNPNHSLLRQSVTQSSCCLLSYVSVLNS